MVLPPVHRGRWSGGVAGVGGGSAKLGDAVRQGAPELLVSRLTSERFEDRDGVVYMGGVPRREGREFERPVASFGRELKRVLERRDRVIEALWKSLQDVGVDHVSCGGGGTRQRDTRRRLRLGQVAEEAELLGELVVVRCGDRGIVDDDQAAHRRLILFSSARHCGEESRQLKLAREDRGIAMQTRLQRTLGGPAVTRAERGGGHLDHRGDLFGSGERARSFVEDPRRRPPRHLLGRDRLTGRVGLLGRRAQHLAGRGARRATGGQARHQQRDKFRRVEPDHRWEYTPNMAAKGSDQPRVGMTAVYPGSFDPVTYGHVDIVERAARVFDKVVLGVGRHPSKRCFFSQEERRRLLQESVSHLDNVVAESFDGLVVNFCKDKDARVIVRGLRATLDFESEFQMGQANRDIAPDIETIFFFCAPHGQFISSSLVKEIASHQGDYRRYVPACVYEATEKRFAELGTGG